MMKQDLDDTLALLRLRAAEEGLVGGWVKEDHNGWYGYLRFNKNGQWTTVRVQENRS